MDRLLILSALIIIFAIGFFQIRKSSQALEEKIKFADDFLDHFRKYYTNGGRDMDTYQWLVFRSNKMQSQLGVIGIYAQYRPPFANYIVSNYPIILNTLPALRDSFSRPSRLTYDYAMAIEECVIRYLGVVDEWAQTAQQRVKNPLVWFREGIQTVLGVPFYILSSFGIMSTVTLSRISNNKLFKVVGALVGLLAFISSIIGIVTGWDAFGSFIRRTLNLP